MLQGLRIYLDSTNLGISALRYFVVLVVLQQVLRVS